MGFNLVSNWVLDLNWEFDVVFGVDLILQMLFPGLWLSEINADMYKVNENLELAKVIQFNH